MRSDSIQARSDANHRIGSSNKLEKDECDTKGDEFLIENALDDLNDLNEPDDDDEADESEEDAIEFDANLHQLLCPSYPSEHNLTQQKSTLDDSLQPPQISLNQINITSNQLVDYLSNNENSNTISGNHQILFNRNNANTFFNQQQQYQMFQDEEII